MARLKDNWITALTLFAAGFFVFVSIGVLVGSDGDLEAWRVGYAVGGTLGAAAVLGGVRAIRTDSMPRPVAHALVVAGMAGFAAGYWWFFLAPPVIAAVVVYAGVVRGGLARELRTTDPASA